MGAADIALSVAGFIAGGVFGILSLLPSKDVTPDLLAHGNSLIRIGIGLNATPIYEYPGRDMGGALPNVRVYNENFEVIGLGHNGNKFGPGQWATIQVDQNGTGIGQQPTYLELAGAANDPICIAYIGQTWSDGTKLGWLGDVGQYCGMPFYYSNLFVAKTDGEMHKPFCTWIGGNGTEFYSNFRTGMRIHTPDFGRLGGDNDFSIPINPGSLCAPPSTWWYYTPLQISAGLRRLCLSFSLVTAFSVILGSASGLVAGTIKTKMDEEPGNTSWQSTIIGSKHEEHSAIKLCANPNAWGPDLVSFSEQVFCDMTTRMTWPLCASETNGQCYDWHRHTLIDGRMRKRAMRYERVLTWD